MFKYTYKVIHNGKEIHSTLQYEQAFGFALGFLKGSDVLMDFENSSSPDVMDKWTDPKGEPNLLLITRIQNRDGNF